MKLNRIGKSSDFISECGKFKIAASNDHDGTYMPLIIISGENCSPAIFLGLSDNFVAFENAKDIIAKAYKLVVPHKPKALAEEDLEKELYLARKKVGELYCLISGKTDHFSDCSVFNAPALMPEECDCGCDH